MTSHAKLSASASKRWMSCPPSVALEANFPDKTTSYAEEGTKAHGLGELLLRVELGGNDGADIAEAQAYSAECSKEMQDAVDVYVDLVLEKFNAAKAISSDAVLLLEQKLNFSKWVPEGFGTGDAIIIADGMCEIIDYKHGKGVQVSAENNSQMRLYALGAYSMYDLFYGIEHVTMTIVQPRKDNISSESMDIKELLIWAKKDVAPKAKLAWAGKGEFKAGDHCQFCRAGATCTARAEQIFQPIQAFDRDDPKLLDDYDIAT
ncbi:MAG: hypothetical protein H6Q67_2336, partial [Firmicutes bacterium]|nr:hypothetical protein [Bacillota bacterium]